MPGDAAGPSPSWRLELFKWKFEINLEPPDWRQEASCHLSFLDQTQTSWRTSIHVQTAQLRPRAGPTLGGHSEKGGQPAAAETSSAMGSQWRTGKWLPNTFQRSSPFPIWALSTEAPWQFWQSVTGWPRCGFKPEFTRASFLPPLRGDQLPLGS